MSSRTAKAGDLVRFADYLPLPDGGRRAPTRPRVVLRGTRGLRRGPRGQEYRRSHARAGSRLRPISFIATRLACGASRYVPSPRARLAQAFRLVCRSEKVTTLTSKELAVRTTLGIVVVAVSVVLAPAFGSAQTVKITPLGSHAGEFCQNDRALLFEDPTGLRIL